MLKVDIHPVEDGLVSEIESQGSLSEISEDISRVILTTYNTIKQQDPLLAHVFRVGMTSALGTSEFWSLQDSKKESFSSCVIRKKK